jgi:hypothetical protein
LSVIANAQNTNIDKISVKIKSPAHKSRAGQKVSVKGIAYMPGGLHLWVIARHKDFKPLWWPQREAEVDPTTGEWDSLAFLGGPQDIGSEFDIGAIVVNEESHAKLRDYWLKAMRNGDWQPIEIPETIIAPELIRVTKRSH